MSARATVFQNFEGGWSTDKKVGIRHSQAYTQGFDFRKSPSQMSVLPGSRREDPNIVDDLILNEVITDDGTIYATGNQGNFYKRTTAGVWSSISSFGAGTGGIDYRRDTHSIYITTDRDVGYYGPLNTTPYPQGSKYAESYSTYNGTEDGTSITLNSFQQGSEYSTTLATAVVESEEKSRYFQTDIEPLKKISVFVLTKGTGDWTLTLHDGLNNVLGTSTVTNANLNNNSFNDFEFTSAPNDQVRLYVAPNARTYHFHLTSTVADGTVASSQPDQLSTCDLMIWADRLVVTENGLHPMTRFLQYEAIGNGNYLSIWEPLSDPPTNDEWLRHRLVFPEEYEVCGLAVLNEYLAIACERVPISTNGGLSGVIFWWDGVSPTYNYFTVIPEGAPYGLREYKNVVYYFAGGAEYAIAGANSVPQKIRTMPGTDTEFSGTNSSLVVYPYSSTTRRGIHLIGYPGYTTNSSIDYGVYSWGAVDKNYPQSFGYNYLISTGSKNYSAQNNLKIGMVKNFGDILHISWQDDQNGGYGIDVVDNASDPASYAKWQGLIIDGGYVGKQKTGVYIEAYYDIPEGATITLGYSIDRGDFATSEEFSTTNQWQGMPGYARFEISGENATDGRFYELQPQIEITCDDTVSTPPVVYMVTVVYNDNKDEAII